MATYSFPALGFDPAPGDPDAIDAVARESQQCARDLSADAEQLRRLTRHLDWQGAAADAFAAHPTQLHDDLSRAGDAHGGIGTALSAYAAALRSAQLDARRLEQEAAEARARADRHAGEVDRLVESMGVAAPGAGVADIAAHQSVAQRLQAHAEDDFQLAVTRARAVERMQREAGDHAAARIRALSDAPYHEPGLLSRMAHGMADWVGAHADELREISNVLKTASAIAGLLSFIPVLTPIFAPIAAVAAGGALVIDAALVATGHGDWKALAVDAALMALPGAGRITSAAVLARREGRAVKAEADAIQGLGLSSRERPSTVVALATRNLGANRFIAASRGPLDELHPELRKALDRVPAELRSRYHGKCAEIRAINAALHKGARLAGSILRSAKVRALGNPEHGMPKAPCSSCQHVLNDFRMGYRQ